ncbi:MAG TPA: nucleotidyltransferase family protein [Candidatus Nanoarchaeia archaeon]|nr:nucleotidyltransferase family protein [Candidatus Nanoarchaeia archaeon]
MRAIILAGGRGSRLGKLTESRPKPLVEVSGKPILEHLIRNALEAGIREYWVNVGYLGHMIKEYFENGSRFGVNIHYFESVGKGPEQPLFTLREYLGKGTFYCFCGDNILIPSQIEKIIKFHLQMSADATFTLEQGEPKTVKRVRVKRNKILGSSTNMSDPVLVYNMAMQKAFLDVLYETVKDREEKAFAFAMDDLADRYDTYALNIPFININRYGDIQNAEIMLVGADKNEQRC